MDSKRLTNVLLIVIAVCLAMLIAKDGRMPVTSEAHAQTSQPSVQVVGCHRYSESPETTCILVPIRVDQTGYLLTRAR